MQQHFLKIENSNFNINILEINSNIVTHSKLLG